MTDYQVDTEALRKVAEAMRLPAKTLRSALQKFEQTTHQLGEPWGDDEIGEHWAGIYKPGLVKVHAGLTQIADGLDDTADNFAAMSLLYQRTEDANLH